MWSFSLDGFLLIFLGQNPWLLASALVLNCYLALDQPLNLCVSASPSGKQDKVILQRRHVLLMECRMASLKTRMLGSHQSFQLLWDSDFPLTPPMWCTQILTMFGQCFHFMCVYSLSPAGLKALWRYSHILKLSTFHGTFHVTDSQQISVDVCVHSFFFVFMCSSLNLRSGWCVLYINTI